MARELPTAHPLGSHLGFPTVPGAPQDLLEVVASEALKRLSELPQVGRQKGNAGWKGGRGTNSEFKMDLSDFHGI